MSQHVLCHVKIEGFDYRCKSHQIKKIADGVLKKRDSDDPTKSKKKT